MLKVVMSWMVKKLRWFLILLVIHPIILLPSLLPRDSKFKSSPVPPEISNPLLMPFLLQLLLLYHTRPALNPEVRPSPIQQPRTSPILTSQQLQPVASTSRRREELPPLPFPVTQVFQHRDQWPIQVTSEYPNTASESQDAVAGLFRRVDRNSREVIMNANDGTILGNSPEEMAARFSWYEDELINDFQKTSDHLGRDN
ncbi:hypothetical protein O181_032773 [Austropuccinia psidii MF-1]|uniref:Uncharacterized protein n=1 Tax=Austropuccinia psidii MF-1 TaxID=1389203 RepID=A0A9Q3H5T6_9BASI|nr:hypothetical protein [Austropuccinia psidii MF-1]